MESKPSPLKGQPALSSAEPSLLSQIILFWIIWLFPTRSKLGITQLSENWINFSKNESQPLFIDFTTVYCAYNCCWYIYSNISINLIFCKQLTWLSISRSLNRGSFVATTLILKRQKSKCQESSKAWNTIFCVSYKRKCPKRKEDICLSLFIN